VPVKGDLGVTSELEFEGATDVELLNWLGDHKSELAIGLIPALLVVPIIWILARPVAWWQSRQADKHSQVATENARQVARLAIESEIDSNLAQLTALWRGLGKSTSNFEPRPLTPDLTAAFRLSAMDPIRWQRTVWEERAVQTTAALDPVAFTRAKAFYEDLNRFDVLKGGLGKPIATLAHNYRLGDGGMHSWKELRELVARRLAEGNPLTPAKADDETVGMPGSEM
jgi:hypothetical protein